jgi:FkbM family methyltransferase
MHRWAVFGLMIDGRPVHPCCDKECEESIAQNPDGTLSSGPAWPMAMGGVKLDIEDSTDNGLSKFIARDFERWFDPLISKISFKPGDIIVDIGAYVGIPSIFLAKMFPMTKVYAIEPHPENYDKLIRNIKVNGADNVLPFNLGVTKDGRKIKLSYSKLNGVTPSEFTIASFNREVETIKLSDFFEKNNIEKCKYMNIDCEGSEHEIIMDNPALFDRVEYLSGEFHINNRVAALGYNIAKTYDVLIKHIKPKNLVINGLLGENGTLTDTEDSPIVFMPLKDETEPCPVCRGRSVIIETDNDIDYYECVINHHLWDKKRK